MRLVGVHVVEYDRGHCCLVFVHRNRRIVCGCRDHRRFVHVLNSDERIECVRELVGVSIGAIRNDQRHCVDIVHVRVGWILEVRNRGWPKRPLSHGSDLKKSAIRTADAVEQLVTVIIVDNQVGDELRAFRADRIHNHAASTQDVGIDDRCVIHIRDLDRQVAKSIQAGCVLDADGDLINVVRIRVGRLFKVCGR